MDTIDTVEPKPEKSFLGSSLWNLVILIASGGSALSIFFGLGFLSSLFSDFLGTTAIEVLIVSSVAVPPVFGLLIALFLRRRFHRTKGAFFAVVFGVVLFGYMIFTIFLNNVPNTTPDTRIKVHLSELHANAETIWGELDGSYNRLFSDVHTLLCEEVPVEHTILANEYVFGAIQDVAERSGHGVICIIPADGFSYSIAARLNAGSKEEEGAKSYWCIDSLGAFEEITISDTGAIGPYDSSCELLDRR